MQGEYECAEPDDVKRYKELKEVDKMLTALDALKGKIQRDFLA